MPVSQESAYKPKRKNGRSARMIWAIMGVSFILLLGVFLMSQVLVVAHPDLPPPTAISLPTPKPTMTP
ncbi:hypothetical protein G4Y79_07880 [Phototrophicus methaneseepsis]|uniref:Uncharacterized protein n=1 Tax=Phototrophicus methaneseepsis TaxID=2710758 RepID=A0A7S8ECA0_9CHLR|nr:hypothetical protein [Phototrophicus methaneseepsis]QPC84281.1 hypothetical protein G4Y79_07880 [Phototrophicus methaneseepsis]